MTTNKTVNQVFTANITLEGQLRVTAENGEVHVQGTTAAFRMLAEVILATVGGGGNIVSQGFKAQLAKGDRSGFALTPDSVSRFVLHCDDKAFVREPEATVQ